MGRKERLYFDNMPLHIGIEGINGEYIFRDEEDYLTYISILKTLASDIYIYIHAFSLQESSIRLLCSFANKDTLSSFMQSLSLKYVAYFNKKYARYGTLWQGRYKSSLVEDRYLLDVMQYIESSSKTQYTSYIYNALVKEESFLKEHEIYLFLGKDAKDRAIAYKNRFIQTPLSDETISFIENALRKQLITGSLEFHQKLEKLAGRSLIAQKRGRPKKDKQNKGKKMFNKLVVLNKEKHKALKLNPLENLNFAKDLNFVPLLVNETEKVAEMFPVVFTATEKPTLVALTSLGNGNLAVNSEGKYIAPYIPAYFRKYPFALASLENDPAKKVIMIDEEASNISKTKGKQLFTKDGSESKVLKNATDFLTEYEKQVQITEAIVREIVQSGILEEREVSIGEGEDKKVLIKGFLVVNRDKLNKLDDAILASWVRRGIIPFLEAHMKSLSKIEVLFKIASQNQQK